MNSSVFRYWYYFKIRWFKSGLWIRIRIGSVFNDFLDPDLDWESGSRIRIQGQENEEK
jgi:hypothetical protein